jgi:hypothetical protein
MGAAARTGEVVASEGPYDLIVFEDEEVGDAERPHSFPRGARRIAGRSDRYFAAHDVAHLEGRRDAGA